MTERDECTLTKVGTIDHCNKTHSLVTFFSEVNRYNFIKKMLIEFTCECLRMLNRLHEIN